jgi:hypothetical protein
MTTSIWASKKSFEKMARREPPSRAGAFGAAPV